MAAVFCPQRTCVLLFDDLNLRTWCYFFCCLHPNLQNVCLEGLNSCKDPEYLQFLISLGSFEVGSKAPRVDVFDQSSAALLDRCRQCWQPGVPCCGADLQIALISAPSSVLAPSSDAPLFLVASLLLVVRPGAPGPSSVLVVLLQNWEVWFAQRFAKIGVCQDPQ